MTIKELKEQAKFLRKGRENHYYIKKYDDISVADLLLVLEDNNFHSEETLVECLVSMDTNNIFEACDILVKHHEAGYLTDELSKRRAELDKENRQC